MTPLGKGCYYAPKIFSTRLVCGRLKLIIYDLSSPCLPQTDVQGERYEIVCNGCDIECEGCTIKDEHFTPVCLDLLDHTQSKDGTATLETLVLDSGYWRATNSSWNILACFNEKACRGGVTGNPDYCLTGYQGPCEQHSNFHALSEEVAHCHCEVCARYNYCCSPNHNSFLSTNGKSPLRVKTFAALFHLVFYWAILCSNSPSASALVYVAPVLLNVISHSNAFQLYTS